MPEQEVDPKGLVNFDSPFFDLASVYGRGPDLDPQFYEADGKHACASCAPPRVWRTCRA